LIVCLAELKNKGVSLKPISSDLSVEYHGLLARSKQGDPCTSVLSGSLAGCVLSYCLSHTEAEALSERTPHFAILYWVLNNVIMDVAALVRAASLILARRGLDCVRSYDRFVDMFTYMVDHLDLNVWSCRSTLHNVSYAYIRSIVGSGDDCIEGFYRAARRWFDVASNLGLDIQTFLPKDYQSTRPPPAAALADFVSSLKANQLRQWAKFDVIKKGGSLDDIQGTFESRDLELTSRDSEGLLAIHLAAAFDRVDVLEWLIQSKGASVDSASGSGRTVMQVAEASNASSTTLCLSRRRSSELIATFVSSHQRRRLAIREKRRPCFVSRRCRLGIEEGLIGGSTEACWNRDLGCRVDFLPSGIALFQF
jgi:hypothetical protein